MQKGPESLSYQKKHRHFWYDTDFWRKKPLKKIKMKKKKKKNLKNRCHTNRRMTAAIRPTTPLGTFLHDTTQSDNYQ